MPVDRTLVSSMLRAGGLLLAVAAAGVGLVAFVHQHTAEHIELRRQERTLQQLEAVLPPQRYTNNPAADTLQVRNPRLGTDEPVTAYRARDDGEPEAVVLTVIAPDGYNGPIELLVAINRDGTLAGVRVVEHNETPGLGDAIEAERSDWIRGFRGRSLGDPPREDWTLRQDGGAFDQLTGASITPRAVVRAVARALEYYRDERNRLFTASGEAD